jgi:thiosulfate/3-mercaptopyruvate sulfurtransferase
MRALRAIAAIALCLAAPATILAGQSPLIQPAELKPMVSKVRLVDVRAGEEFAKGHIPGAVRLSIDRLDDSAQNREGLPISVEAAAAIFRELGIDPQTNVVVYDGRGGPQAARFFYVAEFFGHTHVRVLDGGWPAWLAEEGPQETEPRAMPPGRFQPRPHPERIATAEWIQARLGAGAGKPVIIDARTADEYAGKRVAPGARGGHIPGAIHIDWQTTVTGQGGGRMKSPEELKSIMQAAGVDLNREAVVYCGIGMRASYLYLVLRALGNTKVRNYDAAWDEWGGRADLPIER